MKWRGITLGTMMFAVAILAVDFGVLSHLDDIDLALDDERSILVVGLLPMANVVTLGLVGLLRRRRRTPFVIGFQATAWASTLGVLAASVAKFEAAGDYVGYFAPWVFSTNCTVRSVRTSPFEPPPGLLESCRDAVLELLDTYDVLYLVSYMVLFSLPPFLLSVAGGLIVRHVARRRGKSTSGSPLPDVAV